MRLMPAQRRTKMVRQAIASRGFNETINFSFIPRAHAVLFGGGDHARQIENPIAADLDALRPSILPSLLAAAQRNQARGFKDLMLFEIGAQFDSGVPGAQQTVAAGIRVGEPARSWTKSAHAPDAFDAKADMLAALETAMGGAMTARVKPGAASWYHSGRSGTLALGPVKASSSEAVGHQKNLLAYFGELHPKVLAAFDVKGSAAAFEVFLDAIPEPIKAAKSAERAAIERVDVFDLYEGKGIPEGKKSLAIAVRLQPKDRTLTDAEIDSIAQKIIAAVTKATGGTLRS